MRGPLQGPGLPLCLSAEWGIQRSQATVSTVDGGVRPEGSVGGVVGGKGHQEALLCGKGGREGDTAAQVPIASGAGIFLWCSLAPAFCPPKWPLRLVLSICLLSSVLGWAGGIEEELAGRWAGGEWDEGVPRAGAAGEEESGFSEVAAKDGQVWRGCGLASPDAGAHGPFPVHVLGNGKPIRALREGSGGRRRLQASRTGTPLRSWALRLLNMPGTCPVDFLFRSAFECLAAVTFYRAASLAGFLLQ
uniref:Uncharacterized protein gs80 n=1 Tax=Homo sapiens TaxID=9606 RepID=Q96S02_HUMAN|nr:unknown [Homo sapiens]